MSATLQKTKVQCYNPINQIRHCFYTGVYAQAPPGAAIVLPRERAWTCSPVVELAIAFVLLHFAAAFAPAAVKSTQSHENANKARRNSGTPLSYCRAVSYYCLVVTPRGSSGGVLQGYG